MLFNSLDFGIFFVLVYGLYWLLRRSYQKQNVLLLAASFLFYGWWDVRFLFLFILTTTVDFYCALMISRGQVSLRQRSVVALVLISSAFLCVTVQWRAISVSWQRSHLSCSIDWQNLLPHDPFGWAVFVGTVAAISSIALAHPWLVTLTRERRQKAFIIASIVSNLTILGFFKYFDFFASSFSEGIRSLFGITVSPFTLGIILPVGISFYTFQSLAYTIEVYRGRCEPVDRYHTAAAYLSFFPLLVAGPIERPTHLLPQFQRARQFSRDYLREGAWLITWGLFKKMVVADNAAQIVNSVFGPYDHTSGMTSIPDDGLRLLLGVYAFALQIYGDFSGYSDIARGSARLMGFDVMVNFNLPYLAVSPSDFWRRWHISLSTWLRDFLYVPLGGNRFDPLLTYRNLFVTMVLGGLWHGAAWNFLLWGVYQGVLLIAYRMLAPGFGDDARRHVMGALSQGVSALRRVLSVGVVSGVVPLAVRQSATGGSWLRTLAIYFAAWFLMLQLTCIGWLLFRARNLSTIYVFFEGILFHLHGSEEAYEIGRKLLFYGWFLVLFQIAQALSGTLNPMSRWPWFVRFNVWLFVLLSLFALASTESQDFIYFAF